MAMEYIMNMRFWGHYIKSNMKYDRKRKTVRSNSSHYLAIPAPPAPPPILMPTL